MAEETYLSIDGMAAQSFVIHVPRIGPWFCEANIVDILPNTPAKKTIKIGDTFTGVATIDPKFSGDFAGEDLARLVGGAGRWGASLPARPYRNDAGIRASLVAGDAAQEVGETLGSFDGAEQTLGAKYIRQASAARATLEDAARGAVWWVDFAGVTHVGTRPTPAAPKKDSVQLLDFDHELQRATLVTDDLTQIAIGTVINDERLPEPFTIDAYEIHVDMQGLRIVAWSGVKQSAIIDALRDIISAAAPVKLFGKYRYRVMTREVDRVNVQSVSAAQGLPDILSISMAPGVAGVHAELALGAIVYVEFIAGDRADPEITGFGGKGSAGFVPAGLTIGSPDGSAPLAARQGDGTEMLLPPMVFTGTMIVGGTPTPFTAVGQATTGKLLGVVTGGSSHGVKIG